MSKNITIGADPELFLYDTVEEKFVSAEGRFGGTKEEPKKISREGCAYQEDNVMVEYNIPPCSTASEFVTNNLFMLNYLDTLLPKHIILKVEPSAEFDADELSTEQALTFGCSPDFNAWTKDVNAKPEAENSLLRTCGGHIHIGFQEKDDIDFCITLIKNMDIFVGIPMAYLEPTNQRKILYGKAGAFRDTSYGVEYRTPSNFWLSSDNLMKFVFDQTVKAYNKTVEGFFPDVHYKEINEIINENNLLNFTNVIEELEICDLELEKLKLI